MSINAISVISTALSFALATSWNKAAYENFQQMPDCHLSLINAPIMVVLLNYYYYTLNLINYLVLVYVLFLYIYNLNMLSYIIMVWYLY